MPGQEPNVLLLKRDAGESRSSESTFWPALTRCRPVSLSLSRSSARELLPYLIALVAEEDDVDGEPAVRRDGQMVVHHIDLPVAISRRFPGDRCCGLMVPSTSAGPQDLAQIDALSLGLVPDPLLGAASPSGGEERRHRDRGAMVIHVWDASAPSP